MASADQVFPFLQLELPGELGLDEGRYLVREQADGEAEAVLVVTTVGAPPKRTRWSYRRERPTDAGEGGAEPMTATRLTVVQSRRRMEPDEAKAWLGEMKKEREARDDFIAEGVTILNRAIHAQRAASMDPYLQDVAPEKANVVRVGYGRGDEVADGNWSEAVRIPSTPTTRRRRRVDSLRPQERFASVLGAREQVEPFETLLLRARLDLDEGRAREAALQLRGGLDALLSEIPEGVGGDELKDLEALDDLREDVTAAAEEAATGQLSEASTAQVAEALRISERLLRRRRILG